ncbi:MAG: phosphotransferase [Pseudomonadota bacterium]
MSSATDTTLVREAHRFDEDRLARYLARHLPDCAGKLAVRQFKSGQSNPTFLIEAAGRRYVLRKKPSGKLLPSAHMIEREYRVLEALAASEVEVPAVRLLCKDPEVIGTPFYVMDFVAGRIFNEPALPGLERAERGPIFEAMVEALARLHAVEWRAVGLADFGRPDNYVGRQIARWSQQYAASQTEKIPAMDRLMDWLPRHLPEREETTLVHGDYRLGNLIFHPSQPRVVAVLDWELATLGHPLADLAYNCLIFRIPAGLPTLRGLVGIDLEASGIPDEAAYRALYVRRTGRDPGPAWRFFMAYAAFRYAAILQGVYARALQGIASAEDAKQTGDMVAILAALGAALIE